MVPVAMSPLLSAVERRDRTADRAQASAIEALNPRKLRPSIETTVHALMPQRVVLQVHCVDTIALAVRPPRTSDVGFQPHLSAFVSAPGRMHK
jgi:rhamnose utilization protein RhaD (predicted bifunctional aldolase and dehydrogenase)